jgi:ubiquinol-cytochrome c reductase cytochrome c subunit
MSRSIRWTLLVVASVVLTSAGLLALLGEAGAGESEGVGDDAPTGEEQSPDLPPAQAQLAANADPATVAAGEQLFLTACVSCHGVGGVGTPGYPSLIGVGAASADFYLRTGRMPLAFPVPQAPEKGVAYSDAEIEQLVAYVASLGDGPAVPDVDPSRGSRSEGAQLFLANCAPCHQSAGSGGALSYGNHAPSLLSVEPTQMGEAMRIGPGQMPVFGPDTLTDQQVDSIANYVLYLQNPDDAGGVRIGATGPVPEGLVAWLVGLGLLMLVIRWITKEAHG